MLVEPLAVLIQLLLMVIDTIGAAKQAQGSVEQQTFSGHMRDTGGTASFFEQCDFYHPTVCGHALSDSENMVCTVVRIS